MHVLSLAMMLLALATDPSLSAQQDAGGSDASRKASTILVQSETSAIEAAVSIGFSQPVWRDSYDGMLQELAGRYIRLGNGWWSTLDTIGTIEIGGVRVAPGSYFLGLARAADGTFSLLLFDSRKAMQSRLLPYSTALYRGEVNAEFTASLTFGKGVLAKSAPKLEIELTNVPTDPAVGRLAIRWGSHELAAPVKLELAENGDASDGKK